jgi:hypothetical protein
MPDMRARERLGDVTVTAGRGEGPLAFRVAPGAAFFLDPVVAEAVMVADRTAFRNLNVKLMVEFNPRKKVGQGVYHYRCRRFITSSESWSGDEEQRQDYPAQDPYLSTFHSFIPPRM